MAVEISDLAVKTEDDSAMEGGATSPPFLDDKPLSRQTSPNSPPPDYGGEGRLTPERDQRDTLEEQAEEELKVINIPDP